MAVLDEEVGEAVDQVLDPGPPSADRGRFVKEGLAAAGMPILGAIIGVVTTLMGITAVASVLTIASASTS